MQVIHHVARIVVGGLFVIAGASKVAAGPAWPDQAAQLGVSRWAAVPVPWFELVIGALVVVGVASPWPTAVALLTLVVFTAVIVDNLRRGRRPACACFGAWSATPIGWRHVARNNAFTVVAIVALVTS